MNIYLPIANVSQDVLVLLGIGGIVGILSGVFGVGGGFLLTPFLIFLGIPAPVAVATGANQVAGASVSGMIAHWRRGTVDIKMGTVLLIGGIAGSVLGVWLFRLLKSLGHVDVAISIAYVVLLSVLGGLMLIEGIGAILRKRRATVTRTLRGPRRYPWMNALPLRMRFRRSRLYISALVPMAIGFLVGLMSALMGVGGGFIMVPAMIYLIGMPTEVVIGTSLFQIIFVTANVTLLQSVQTQTVDIVLAMLLLVGAVSGAQLGVRLGAKLAAEQLRVLLALLVLAVGGKMLLDLAVRPADLYTVTPLETPWSASAPSPPIAPPVRPVPSPTTAP